jgi:hypothetical protein
MTELTTNHLLCFAIVAMILYYFTSRCGSGFRVGAQLQVPRNDSRSLARYEAKRGIGLGTVTCGCNLAEQCRPYAGSDVMCDLSSCRACETEDFNDVSNLPCTLDSCCPTDYLAENNNDPEVAVNRGRLNALLMALLYPDAYPDMGLENNCTHT